METETQPLEPPAQVLATLNPDGTRRWLAPRLAKGRFWQRRRIVAYLLIALFNLLPWIPIDGRPAILLDLKLREFTFFGVTFQPTETALVMALFLTIFFGIFLATALLGRVWCGWACPQTVYLEFLYRPIERLVEGRYHSKGKAAIPLSRNLLKYLVFVLVSVHLSHTFLAYFVGPREVWSWSTGSPSEHMWGFVIVWGVAALMMLDFASFREQLCTLACPYGRLQSVLLDPDSIVIGYDTRRGEPRGKGKRGPDSPAAAKGLGDCVDCKLCVAVCPTGIDIRNGLQMECVNCAECIDACDSVMDRIGLERGLIRFASENQLEGGKRKFLRVRTVIYTLAAVAALAVFSTLLGTRNEALVHVMRIQGAPYVRLDDGRVLNPVRLRIENRTDQAQTYFFEVQEPAYEVLQGVVSVEVAPLGTAEVNFSVVADGALFPSGRAPLHVRIHGGEAFDRIVERPLLGPIPSTQVPSALD